ncbi:MAG: N-acetylneuraminate synthase family protein, partial [Candidatus Eisenbacteria sp.]|nr:N-acetylneuraminate synthase family protein [Candidatus Eisenbacteria bacterium]
MRIGNHDTDQRVLIIAEIGNNHEGQYGLAEEMIERAARAGADAVKFQTIVPERLVSPRQAERIAQLKRFQLSDEDFTGLSQVARRAGVLFISTPFDLGSVATLEPLVAAYKVSSGDNNFIPLLDRICRTGKPILLSAGLTDWVEIKRSCGHIRDQWRTRGIDPGLGVLHCVSAYPVPPAEANLAVIGRLRELGVTTGYSDHTLGIEAAVLSVAAGARIVEEHFTVDKNYSSFHDHQLSADPADMQELVRRVREVETFLGR